MFRILLVVVTSLIMTACTLDLKLISTATDLPSVAPSDIIDAGFVNQNLPTSLNKTATNFGTISPQKYYFMQPGDSSDVVRKFVKISGGVKTELALPANVISHRYAFSTVDRVYYFMNVRTGGSTSGHYLKALDKAGFSLVDWQCSGVDIDFDVDDFEVWQEGNEGFYFRLNSTNAGISGQNGKLFYSDGTACTNTGVIARKMWKANNKMWVVDQAGSLRQMIAGVPQTVLVDGAATPVVSGMIVYLGDLYFRVQVTAGPTYNIYKAETSIPANTVTNTGFDSANWISLEATAESIDNTTFIYCQTVKCMGTGNVYVVTMMGLPTLGYSGANLGPARILPFPSSALVTLGVSGRRLYSLSPYLLSLNTGIDSEYGGTAATEKVPENYPQQVFMPGFYFSEFFNPNTGESSIQKTDIVTEVRSTAFPALKNSHSLRLRGGELFFLAHNNEKLQLYRSDGTVGGTTAVSQVTSDDYRLGSDFTTSTKLVRRSFDITKEGTDLYVFTASQESVYLAEYYNGDMKYIKIPGAVYNYSSSRILKVTADAVYFATPAHYHIGRDLAGTNQPLDQAPGVQLASYDGTNFTYWLRSNLALPSYSSYAFEVTGQSWLGIGTTRILSVLVSSIQGGGFFLRKTYSLTSTTQTDLTVSDTPHSRISANGDRFIYNIYTGTPGEEGIYLQRAGVQLKLTTTAEEARDFRWDGMTAYFVAPDTVDGLLYIWSVDTTQTTPAPTKVSAAVTIGTAKQEAFSYRVFTVGTDKYFLFPDTSSDDSDLLSTSHNLWKISGGTATKYSDDKVEEVLPVSSGFYYIARAATGPDAGKRCIFKHTSDGDGQSACHKYISSMKPSSFGVSVTVDSKVYQLKADLTFVELASLIGGTATPTDFEATLDTYSAGDSFNNLSALCRFSSAGGKILNLGINSSGLTWSGISRNTDGTSVVETTFAGGDVTADYSTGMVAPATDRVNYYSFQPAYTPQLNSILFSTRNTATTQHFKIFGSAGILDTNIP